MDQTSFISLLIFFRFSSVQLFMMLAVALARTSGVLPLFKQRRILSMSDLDLLYCPVGILLFLVP